MSFKLHNRDIQCTYNVTMWRVRAMFIPLRLY